jgi:predicted DsbA family dithiol-disulfide isomerase
MWSDIQHPWSYIGKRRLDRAWSEFRHADEVVVVHHAFRLDRDVPPGDAAPAVDGFAAWPAAPVAAIRSQLNSVEQAGAFEGIELHAVGAALGDTTAAHRLLHLARRHGLQWPLLERLFRAQFTERRPLLDHGSLVALAAEAGIDEATAGMTLAGDDYADAVRADVHRARTLGISAVPFFLLDGYHRIAGAQPTEAFAYALRRVWADRHRTPPARCHRARARSLRESR